MKNNNKITYYYTSTCRIPAEKHYMPNSGDMLKMSGFYPAYFPVPDTGKTGVIQTILISKNENGWCRTPTTPERCSERVDTMQLPMQLSGLSAANVSVMVCLKSSSTNGDVPNNF